MLLTTRIAMTALILFLILPGGDAAGQQIHLRHKKKSKPYIQDYYKKYIVVRAFESTKFNNFRFTDGPTKVIYKPNEHNNLGLGITYKFISLNLGFHIPYADKNEAIYGKTRQIDLQTHIYSHKFIIDFFGQFYRGFYLDNPSVRTNYAPLDVIKRPDLRSRDLSLSVQYVFNYAQFSYNAPTYQNEVQKKSAGSFIAGARIYHSSVQADSSVIPPDISDSTFFNNNLFTKAGHTGLGVNGGYGYTLVIRKCYFITAILTGGTGIGYSDLYTPGKGHTGSWAPGFELGLRCAAGYNYGKYFAGVSYLRLQTKAASAYPGTWQQADRGNFRVIVAKRFSQRRSLIPKTDLLKAD